MASLAEIRAKLLEQENRGSNNKTQSGGDNAIFPHWNIPDNTSATLRFLPDGDMNNPFFWAKREMINLEFSGVKGGDEAKPVTIKVPCIEMYEDEKTTCPVHAELRQWFKDPSLEDMARKYWKKKSYIFQGYVVDSELNEETVPENPIRRFAISPQIFKVVSAALMDTDFQSLPTDYNEGTDFKIVKGQNGKWADYSMSNWARRERSLDQTELDAIETNGLFNLGDFLPKKPTAEDLAVIMEMFEASVDGQLYDPQQWGNFYRPWGVDAPADARQRTGAAAAPRSAPAPATTPKAETPVVEDDAPFDADPAPVQETAPAPSVSEAPSGDAKPSAQDILAAIRNRKTEA